MFLSGLCWLVASPFRSTHVPPPSTHDSHEVLERGFPSLQTSFHASQSLSKDLMNMSPPDTSPRRLVGPRPRLLLSPMNLRPIAAGTRLSLQPMCRSPPFERASQFGGSPDRNNPTTATRPSPKRDETTSPSFTPQSDLYSPMESVASPAASFPPPATPTSNHHYDSYFLAGSSNGSERTFEEESVTPSPTRRGSEVTRKKVDLACHFCRGKSLPSFTFNQENNRALLLSHRSEVKV